MNWRYVVGWMVGVDSGAAVYASSDSRQWWHVAFVVALGAAFAWFVATLSHRWGQR